MILENINLSLTADQVFAHLQNGLGLGKPDEGASV
jgi:hypothetical protein